MKYLKQCKCSQALKKAFAKFCQGVEEEVGITYSVGTQLELNFRNIAFWTSYEHFMYIQFRSCAP